MEDILDGDRRLEGGASVPGGPFALHDRDHRQLLVRQAIGLRVARTNTGIVNKVGDSHRPIGLLELAGGAARCDEIMGASDAGAALSIQRRPSEAPPPVRQPVNSYVSVRSEPSSRSLKTHPAMRRIARLHNPPGKQCRAEKERYLA